MQNKNVTMVEINKDFIKKFQAEKKKKDFEIIFNFYAPKIKSLLVRNGADVTLAEDIMHDTMINIWDKTFQRLIFHLIMKIAKT